MARQPRNYQREYERRIAHGSDRGFSRSQSRGHPGKNQVSVTHAKDIAKRYEIPIGRAAKIGKNAKPEKFDVQGTFRTTETVPVFDPSEVQRIIDSAGPNYVGTSVRVKLKDGRYYQSRTFGDLETGSGFYLGLQSKYGFDDGDVQEIEVFNTESAS